MGESKRPSTLCLPLVCEQRDGTIAISGPIWPATAHTRNNSHKTPNDCEVLQDDRIASLNRTWRGPAALATERNVNEKRQSEMKLAGPLSLGDAVVLPKPDCNC